MDDAAQFIDTVGFCLLFASTHASRIELPSLFEAVKGRRDAHIEDWDKDSDKVWVWKNDLPATRRAYYGKAMTGKPIFISLAMLPNIIALFAPETRSVNEEYQRGRISQASKRVYDTLSAIGPTPTLALREATGLDQPRYHRALDELQRALVILPVGATLERGAWPSQIFDLVARWFAHQFDRAQKIDADAACRAVVRRYVETVRVTQAAMLARVFALPRDRIMNAVDELTTRGVLSRKEDWILMNGK